MLSVSVSEQVKFKSKKCGTVSVLPVTVEFGKFCGHESQSNGRLKRTPNSGGTTRADRQINSDNLTAPSELLHAVVALYHTYLPGYPLDLIYKTLCRDGSRTLLLLRDGTVVDNNAVNKTSGQNTGDSVQSPDENDVTDSGFGGKSGDDPNVMSISSPSSSSSPDELPNNVSDSPLMTTANDETIDNASVVSGDGYQSDNWSVSSFRQHRYRSINDILNDYLVTTTRPISTTDGYII
ncbi:uncharacterized protein LOC128960385 [Oppia nitens]|uniref:uncharacterized protein LOC128960385 n=1 Tax=Oppia nitens TaxID=1686743 RepID=UPI0023DC917A|nr:uncharacterized protein LOC128960385 [Oppia nitens]